MDMSHEFSPTGEKPKNTLVSSSEQQPIPENIFNTRIKTLFANKKDYYSNSQKVSALEHVESVLSSSDCFTDNWWKGFYKWLDEQDFHKEKNQVAEDVFDTLTSFPKDAKLPHELSYWASRALREPQQKERIVNTLDNPEIPSSLRAQIPAQLARHPDTWSLDVILQGYKLFREPVGQEMRKQIVPLFMSGLAVNDVFDANKDDLIQLYGNSVSHKEDKAKDSILSRLSHYLRKPADQSERKRQEAERRVIAIRDLVRELYPTHEEYYKRTEELSRLMHELLKSTPSQKKLELTGDEHDAIERLGKYEHEINDQYNNNTKASQDASTLPVDTLERYLSEIRQLKTIPNFEELTPYVIGGRISRGIVTPYTALGRASTGRVYGANIPLRPILNHLNGMDKSESLNDQKVDEFLLGINENLTSNDQTQTLARRNLRVLMKHQFPPKIPGFYFDSILTIPREDLLRNVLDTVVSMSHEDKPNHRAMYYLTSKDVIDKLRDLSINQGDVNTFLEGYKTVAALAEEPSIQINLLEEFRRQFDGEKTANFFTDMNNSYRLFPEQLLSIVQLTGKSAITRERAVELPTKAGDILANPLFPLAWGYPKRFLATDQASEFFRNMLVSYQSNAENIKLAATALENNHITSEFALAFPQQAPALMQDKMKESRIFVLNHGNSLIKDVSDLKFLNRLVGEFGQKADFLIRGYKECLEAGAVTTDEKELVLEFAKQFRVVAPATLAGYKEARQGGFEKGYIAQLKTLAEKMTGSGTITEEESKKPYYKDLLKHVYSNNAGNWSSFESNDSCSDRSSDLADFKIKPRYEIDLLSQSEIRVKAGETFDSSVQDEVQKPIIEVAKRMEALGHDKEKIKLMLKENIDKTLMEITQKGGLQGIDLSKLTSTEEAMFLLLTDSIYGTRSIDPKIVKDLVMTYEFATFEDISDYMAGTRDRVSRANNQDYALLCEVGAFYSDRIKEVNRRLVETAYKNPQIAALMPEYFRQLSQESSATQKQDRINRLQIDRLGASESFVKQLTGVLEKRRGRKYDPEEVKEIIRRYEGVTGGLQEKASTSQNAQTRAFYGQLRSQRKKSFEALRVITGEDVDPQKVHLGEINLQQALETETGIKEGKYIEDQFASYTAQRFIDLFEDQRMKIEGELAKFESISGKQREVLYGYVTKTKESANARMVGGVCVAGDNPSKNKDKNMWDMPNYFQLVFQEPDTLQCQGLVLLHHFTQDGKRVLAASLNPSSTYLYSVDETAMFNGVMETLEQFAKDNSFDMITFSQNRTIRTNRTGGQFERTMDAKIASVRKKFTFSSPQTFSYSPNYQLQDMDAVWERKT